MLDFLKRRNDDRLNIKQEFTCKHPGSILTKYICSNNSIQYVMQCTVCKARTSSPISHKSLTTQQRNDAPLFDEVGRSERRKEKYHRYALHREWFNSDAWWKAYKAYLISNEWIDKRQQVLNRDHWKCQERRRGCTLVATEVHHLTYENVGDEPLDDLLSVCHECHELITKESRITWRTL